MGIRLGIIALSAVPHVAVAESLSLQCVGRGPDWSLTLEPESATFAYLDRESTLDIPQKSNAEGADWPKAMTLIGPRDSAIIIIHRRECGAQSHEMQVLTQRGETPVLLTGCCSALP